MNMKGYTLLVLEDLHNLEEILDTFCWAYFSPRMTETMAVILPYLQKVQFYYYLSIMQSTNANVNSNGFCTISAHYARLVKSFYVKHIFNIQSLRIIGSYVFIYFLPSMHFIKY